MQVYHMNRVCQGFPPASAGTTIDFAYRKKDNIHTQSVKNHSTPLTDPAGKEAGVADRTALNRPGTVLTEAGAGFAGSAKGGMPGLFCEIRAVAVTGSGRQQV